MSVMSCDRNQCENVLCDHYSSEYGYICNECLNELKGNDGWLYNIQGFMDTPKRGELGSTYLFYIDSAFEHIDQLKENPNGCTTRSTIQN